MQDPHHHERGVAGRKVLQQCQVQSSAQIVTVGHKHVFDSLRHERIQHAAAQQRGINVPVARRAPGGGQRMRTGAALRT